MIKKIMMSLMLVALVAGVGWAEVPVLINFQGRLTDNLGAPITTGQTLSFQIFDAASGGALLWTGNTASKAVVPDANGVFNLILGKDTTDAPAGTTATLASLPFDKPYWVEILVNGVTLGRQPLTATPYAMTAKNVYGGTGYFSGNVGIGTTKPGQKLEVKGTVYVNAENSGLVVDSDGNSRVGLMKYSGIDGAVLVHAQDVPLRFGSATRSSTVNGGTFYEQMTLTKSGYLGIGTTEPTSKLEIVADTLYTNSNLQPHGQMIRSGGDYPMYLMQGTDKTNGISYIQSMQIQQGLTGTTLRLNPRGGSVSIGTTAQSSNLIVNGNIEIVSLLDSNNVPYNGIKFGDGSIQTQAASGGGGWAAVAGTNDIANTNTGNVGIGTAAPVAPLEVQMNNASGQGLFLLTNANSAGNATATWKTGSNDQMWISTIGSTGWGGLADIGLIQSNHGLVLSAGTTNPTNVVIQGGGNIGVGTTAPVALLDIGSTTINNNGLWVRKAAPATIPNSAGKGVQLFYDEHSGTDQGGAYTLSYGAVDAYDYNGHMPQKLILNPSGGMVGVNTKYPAYTLDVVGDINFSGNLLHGKSVVDVTGAGAWKGASNGTDIYDNTGKVGIGTTAPVAPLDVSASTNSSIWLRSSSQSNFGSAAGTGLRLYYDTTQGTYNGANTGVVQAAAYTANGVTGQSLSLNPFGGNVGINRSAPSYQLDVNGDINYTGTLRNGGTAVSGWPFSGSNLYYTAGSVGIGTTNPGSGYTDIKFEVDSAMKIGPNNVWSSGANKSIYFGDGQYVSIGEKDADDMMTLHATKYYFDNGNVGIKTASPNAPLQFSNDYGDAPLNSYSKYKMILFDGQTAASSYGLGIEPGNMSFNTNGGYKFYRQGGSTPVMCIGTADNGNVGIGKSPYYNLDVQGTGAFTGQVRADSGIAAGGGVFKVITISNVLVSPGSVIASFGHNVYVYSMSATLYNESTILYPGRYHKFVPAPVDALYYDEDAYQVKSYDLSGTINAIVICSE